MNRPPRTDRPEPLAAKVASALDRLARAQRIERRAVAARAGLTLLQVDLLAVLADGPPPDPTVSLLAAEVAVTQPTTTDSLRALADKGLVVRRQDPIDGRRAMIELTPAGRRLTADLTGVADEVTAAIAGLPSTAQEDALRVLLAVIAQLVARGAVDVARTCLTCRHHRHDGTTHHCVLLQVDLPPAELRVNCPDHQAA